MVVTNRQQLVCAAFLIAWVGGCAGQHVKGRRAMKEKIRMEAFEPTFYATVGQIERLHGEAVEVLKERMGHG